MRQILKFLIALLASLAVLTWLTSVVVQRTTHRWFEKDVRLRAHLVVSGAHDTLSAHWKKEDRRQLEKTLAEITRDERIMAAAARSADSLLLVSHTFEVTLQQ